MDLIDLPASLKLLIEDKIGYEECPELYCFGLLWHFDIREYIAMASSADIHFSDIMGSDERADREFEQLKLLFRKWEHTILKY